MQMRKASLAMALASLLLLSGCLGAADDGPPDIFNGDDIYPVQAVPDFSLRDHEGNGFNISDYDGQVIVIVFMFTRCPDVCPVVSSNTLAARLATMSISSFRSLISSICSKNWVKVRGVVR